MHWRDGVGTFDHIDAADSRLVWSTNIAGQLYMSLIDASEPFSQVVSFDPFRHECMTCSCDITVSNNGRYVWVLLCVETVIQCPRGGILDMVLCQIPTISLSNPGGGEVVDAVDRCIKRVEREWKKWEIDELYAVRIITL